SPFAAASGTLMLNWYSPVALSPANVPATDADGVTSVPPNVIRTWFASTGAPLSTCPFTTAGVVGPKPVANNWMISPGLAGVVDPGNSVVGPSRLESRCRAAMYLSKLNRTNAGVIDCICAVELTTCPFTVTSTFTGPLDVSIGASALICPALMNDGNAGLPL